MNIIDRQTVLISVDFNSLTTSEIQSPINLRFAADELILKSISYSGNPADENINVQIWCNITNDNLIGAFPAKSPVALYLNSHFRISNSFQTQILHLQFQRTDNGQPPFFYNPQDLITDVAGAVNGIVSLTLEFIKLSK